MAQATLTRRELIRFAAVAGAVAACTPVSSPAPGPSQSAAEKKPHGTLTIGSDLSGFDLQPNNFLTISMVGTSLFDGLTASGPKGVIQPRLATAWKALDDKNTWEFTLREGVTFSNGERFDAQSVKFTVEKTLNDKLRWAGRLATIKSVTIINDYTVQVTTDGPDALLPGRLSLYMMPPKQVAAEGLNTFGLHPAGTRSYVIDSYIPCQLVDSDGFGYNPDVKAFGYDPAKAKQLLAEAGYPNGFSTQITVLAGNPMGGEVIGQALAQYFDKVGVKAEILPTDGAQWISKWYGGGRSPLFLGL